MTQLTLIETALQRAAVVSSLLQGEVLGVVDACVVLADASAPLSAEAADIAMSAGSESGLIVVPNAVDDVVLLLSPIDPLGLELGPAPAQWGPFLVAAVLHTSEQFAYEALRGRRPGFAGLPWAGLTAVADLSRITIVERSVLVGAISRGRPRTLREQLHFSETIGRYLTRPALPDPVNEVLAPFVKRIAEKQGQADVRTRYRSYGWRRRRTSTMMSRHSTSS